MAQKRKISLRTMGSRRFLQSAAPADRRRERLASYRKEIVKKISSFVKGMSNCRKSPCDFRGIDYNKEQ